MAKRKKSIPLTMPTLDEFRRGCLAFRNNERRDAMYKTATFLVQHFWNNPAEIANGLGVLLLTWNQAHFRYGSFDFQLLEQTLIDEQQQLGYFRDKDRDILRYVPTDDPAITSLFNEFLEALRIRGAKGKKNNSKSPVAVAKALHLLAPSYFPLWDNKIAGVYKCNYGKKPADAYLRFVKKMRHLAEHLTAQGVDSTESGVTLLKLIDEYNYATYTKHWRYRKVRTTQ